MTFAGPVASGRTSTTLVIGPSGVFVIDSKNWAGAITLKSGVLRQNGYNRSKAVEGALDAADAIRALVPSLDRRAFISVLCFVGDTTVSGSVHGIEVCHSRALLSLLTGRPATLSPEWLSFLRFELDMSTRDANARVGRPRTTPTNPPAVSSTPPAPRLTLPVTSPARQRPIGWRGTRGLLRRLLGGIVLWWFSCIVVYFGLGPMTHHSPTFLGPAYVVLGLLSVFLVTFVVT